MNTRGSTVLSTVLTSFMLCAVAQNVIAENATAQSDFTQDQAKLPTQFPTAIELSQLPEKERQQWAEKTEVWRPIPPVVAAAAIETKTPPSDAIILLGENPNWQSAWQSAKEGSPAAWTFQDGVLTVKPGTGDIRSKAEFCDIQLHLEWRTPTAKPTQTGQQRNNSGIFLQERYEIQILDSYVKAKVGAASDTADAAVANGTYPNGQAGALYKQKMPLVNASSPPQQWQSYDIIYQAPRFDGDKKLKSGAVTVLHNGVLVQNHTEIAGTTEWIGPPKNQAHGCAPLKLQDHGDLVSFRNIWVRQL